MNKSKVKSILPLQESDNANEIIKKDKKLLSIAMIVLLSLTIVLMLITFIVAVVLGDAAAAITTIVAAALGVIEIIVLISVAHNISRQTAVLIKIAEKLLQENPLPNTDDKKQDVVAYKK